MDKTILLASFIFPERLDWFTNYLENKFNITKDKIFCYKNIDDESKLIITFKLHIKDNETIDFKKLFPSAIIVHKKGNAFYTINALNKLIETNQDDNTGNIDFKSVRIDWEKYQNKLIIIDNKKLVFFNIKRIF